MKRLFAIFALLLTLGAPLAQAATAEKGTGGGGSTTTSPDGEVLD